MGDNITCDRAAQDGERLHDFVHMVVVRIVRVTSRGIQVRGRQGTLRVWCAGWSKEATILRAKTIKPHAHCKGLISINGLTSGIELKSRLGRVYVAVGCSVVPLL